jgi:hypothetical protein
MEAAAKHDLAGRLGGGRRPVSPDSTTGVSLSSLTKPARMGTQILAESQDNFQLKPNIAMDENIAIERVVTIERETFELASSFRPIELVSRHTWKPSR